MRSVLGLCLIFLANQVQGYTVLVITALPFKSLNILGASVVSHLLNAGHEVLGFYLFICDTIMTVWSECNCKSSRCFWSCISLGFYSINSLYRTGRHSVGMPRNINRQTLKGRGASLDVGNIRRTLLYIVLLTLSKSYVQQTSVLLLMINLPLI